VDWSVPAATPGNNTSSDTAALCQNGVPLSYDNTSPVYSAAKTPNTDIRPGAFIAPSYLLHTAILSNGFIKGAANKREQHQ
jgi:hypothetical protein